MDTATRTAVTNPRATKAAWPGYLYAYVEMACQTIDAIAGRYSDRTDGNPDAQDRLDAYVAEFRATAEISDQHAQYVAAVHSIAATAPAEKPATQQHGAFGQLGDNEKTAVLAAFDAAFPQPPEYTYEQPAPAFESQGQCHHGVSYSDDCPDCEE